MICGFFPPLQREKPSVENEDGYVGREVQGLTEETREGLKSDLERERGESRRRGRWTKNRTHPTDWQDYSRNTRVDKQRSRKCELYSGERLSKMQT